MFDPWAPAYVKFQRAFSLALAGLTEISDGKPEQYAADCEDVRQAFWENHWAK